MPELPEVERVRLTLLPRVTGRRVIRVELRRRDVVRGPATPEALLTGSTITHIHRRGKQLALIAGDDRCVCVHLGMSGSLRWSAKAQAATHTHIIWHFDNGGTLVFRDPRRFGGVWTFPNVAALHDERWSKLGPDALSITPGQLHQALDNKRLALKAALLDQHILAGLGNIYVDELLFACGLSPTREAGSLGPEEVRKLVRRMRRLLGRAVDAGGSTFRDYVDGEGRSGGFQSRHRVYGRGGKPCFTCGQKLKLSTVAGRTTVFCETCQTSFAHLDR